MSELQRIQEQLKFAYSGPAWHGPSVLESLAGVTQEIAARRPIAGAHTIWELVHHIGAWTDVPRRRIQGEMFEITRDIDFPPVVDTSEEGWRRSLDNLAESQKKLIELIDTLSDDRLDQPIRQDGPTLYLLLHGVVQHHIYHAGQISLLKK